MSVGEWVKSLRRAMGITSQEAFAEKLGLGRSAVAKWESGIQTPNLDSFRKLWTMAPDPLREVAPQAIQSLGISDLEHPEEEPPIPVFSKEALAVAEEIDSIQDPFIRKRARNAALTAIEHVQHTAPPKPNGGNGQ